MTIAAIAPLGRTSRAEPVDLVDYRRRAELERLLGECRTVFGAALGRTARGLIRAAALTPGDDVWDEAHGVLVAPGVTLWEAVLMHTDYDVRVSPTFVARTTERGGIRIDRTPWADVPSGEQVVTALRRLHRGRREDA